MILKRLSFLLLMSTFCFGLRLSAQIEANSVKSWAKYERYSSDNELIDEDPDVVFMGNSITDFWARNLPDFFIENNYIGRGISGQTTEQMLARFQQDVVELHPKIVVILAGINDIAQNNGPISNENILRNIKSMCDIARVNGIKPVLCSILPCDYFKWRPDMKPASRVVEVNEMIKLYALLMGFQYVDYYSKMATEDGALNAQFTEDRCHPNLDGYNVMISTIQPILNNMLGN